jgi:hypothetical protein
VIASTKESVMKKKVCALVIVLLAGSGAAAAEPDWQPVLTGLLKARKSARLGGVVVNHDTGCVFVNLGEQGIYCSGAGATRFNPLKDQKADGPHGKFVRALKECKDSEHGRVCGKDARHVFKLTSGGIAESSDGGATWSKPIALPKPLKGVEGRIWIEYDPKNDVLYVMKTGGDLYKLTRRK